ncbi:MAG TPA: phytanoyl-CoA dioxygenase family protein [Lacipirellulaceae bacterium]|jgi:ectoine hydroxylase-related dioxygenase (phytanoyl-CoA dioxygenase family)|nr:phytanoyl-CoA dioxygenase family protein [Lacipirellulaceae bacterium]
MNPTNQIDTSYRLDPSAVRKFREDGFIRLPNVLSGDSLTRIEPEITRMVDEGNRLKEIPLGARTLYDQAFIQVMNLWTRSERMRVFAFGKRLARTATELMGTRGVRIWHDQALYKEPSGNLTPWHVDQQYWPMSNANSVTAWIPLQDVPIEMGPLCFGRGSHQKRIGRDLEIGEESERQIGDAVRKEKIDEVQEPYAKGDVSFHLGWTLHRAGPNSTQRLRRVFTIIYMDIDMKLAAPQNKNQRADWEAWTPSTQLGEVMDDRLNPVLYEHQE